MRLFEKSGALSKKMTTAATNMQMITQCCKKEQDQGCRGSNSACKKAKNHSQVLPRFELGLEESEPSVITNYTIGPVYFHGSKIRSKYSFNRLRKVFILDNL